MGIAIVIMFVLAATMAFLEDRLVEKDKKVVYWTMAAVLVLLAGFREIGIDPDSVNYEYAYHHYDDDRLSTAMESSYFVIAEFLNFFTSDAHAILLFYAFFGLVLKFIAFRRLSEFWFAPVVVYLSFFYELHECTQIRTAIMSGLFMLAIPCIAVKQRLKALLLIALGCVFHISALVLLPFLFLSNKELTRKQQMFWLAIIPCAYVIYVMGSALLVNIPIPYIENKLTSYQDNVNTLDVAVNVFSPLQMFTTMLFVYLLYFQDTIIKHNRYYPLMMKIFSLSLFAYVAFAFLPVLSQRVSYLFRIVTIILFTNIYYTIRPKWMGMLVVVLISFIYLNYALPYISFYLLWGG